MKTQELENRVEELRAKIDLSEKDREGFIKILNDGLRQIVETYFSGIDKDLVVQGGNDSWTFKKLGADPFWADCATLYLRRSWGREKEESPTLELNHSSCSGSENVHFDRMIMLGKAAQVVKDNGEEIIFQLQSYKQKHKADRDAISNVIFDMGREVSELRKKIAQIELDQFTTELRDGVRFESAVEVEKRYNDIKTSVVGIKIEKYNASRKRVFLKLTQVFSCWNHETSQMEDKEYELDVDILTSKMNEQMSYWVQNQKK